MVREGGWLTFWPVSHHAQRVRLQPVLSRTTQQNMVNKIGAIFAGAGPSGSCQPQWGGLSENEEKRVINRHAPVEVAHDHKGFMRSRPRADPVLQHAKLLQQGGAVMVFF